MSIGSAGDTAPTRRRLRLSGTAWVGASIVAFWIAMAIGGPWLAPYDRGTLVSDNIFDPIGSQFLLGTDYLGRDMLSRLLAGARTTLGLAGVGTALAVLIGAPLGMLAAVIGGWVDMALSRAVDALLSIPTLLFGLVIVAAIGSYIPVLLLAAALAYAPGHFRLARALSMDMNVMDFVEVARARGESTWWIARQEILPNIIMPLLTDIGLRFVFVLLFMSGLSFLGLGVQPPDADWGAMVRENLSGLSYGYAAALVPATALASLTIGINLVIDSLSARTGRNISRGGA
jgi:peptide/nickel transport system permease protein